MPEPKKQTVTLLNTDDFLREYRRLFTENYYKWSEDRSEQAHQHCLKHIEETYGRLYHRPIKRRKKK